MPFSRQEALAMAHSAAQLRDEDAWEAHWRNSETRGSEVEALSMVPFATMGGIPDWEISPDAWDTVVVGGSPLPGVCEVTGDVEHKITKQKVPGRSGGPTRYLGRDEAEFTIRVRMWRPSQLNELHKLVTNVFLPALTRDGPSSLRVVHPALQMVGIDHCLVVRVGMPRFIGQGICEVVLRCQQKIGDGNGLPTKKPGATVAIRDAGQAALEEKLTSQTATPKKPSASGAKDP